MTVIDTSVWISYFKGKDKILVETLNTLLDEGQVALPISVQLELLSGIRKDEFPKLKKVLSALPILYPNQSTWETIESWMLIAVTAGKRFGVMDLIVGALAYENGGAIWSLDKDFIRMAKLKFITIFESIA